MIVTLRIRPGDAEEGALAGYRIYLVDGARRELSADRCRHAGSRYIFERESASGGWQIVHEVAVVDVAQLQDGIPNADHEPNS
ncbi:hypothetical protein ETD83_07875 [Actinomadura soli]|uniref:Uncharacterized protein n=1 Tax=Actinomadura soli TaxID=2508997 RepID=A0A5C4JHB1_9ACTN|nr:hypothetical protein [Actinomadura soli]TMR04803.1 hypothetical protein ETD83_07875 [Actinomadura soli]